MRQLFFYGTLRDTVLLANVLGRKLAARDLVPAFLPDFEVCSVKGQEFPFARRLSGAKSPGLLARGLSEAEIERLCYYEGGFLYGLTEVKVEVDGSTETAEVFLSDHAGWVPDGLWDLDRWMAKDRGVAAVAALEGMAFMGQRPAEEVQAKYATIRARAQSRMNALRSAPVWLRRGMGAKDIETIAVRRPYLNFFSLEERDLRFRRFNGGFSEPVERAVFMASDAVNVLPYDPKSDLVLLVEQFRAGPHARGDQYPWCLEGIAGRVDVGETAAETARRETQEEAGLDLLALEDIASYYTSPGAVSEYLTAYIGICDLSGRTDCVKGVASEHEDIRSFVISFDALMAAVQTGEVDNGPLLISALWLAAHRERLRSLYGSA